MDLIVDPVDGPVDVVPAVTVTGAPPGAAVRLVIDTTDAAGNPWRSSIPFTADARGRVVVADALADPGEPWWSMEFVAEERPPVTFAAPPDLLRYRLHLEGPAGLGAHDGSTVVVVRRWAPASVAITEASGEGFRTVTVAPPGAAGGSSPAVVVVGGSAGIATMLPTAGLLAAHGYVATVVGYIEEPGLPPSLREVPLEHLAAGMRVAFAQPAVGAEKVAVLATSVGTEGALAALATFDDLLCRAVVAIAPSSVIWQATGDGGRTPKTSSWTLAGTPLPWAAIRADRLLTQMVPQALFARFRRHPRPRALHLRPAYAAGLAHHPPAAEIPAERIDAPLLLLAGSDDQMWPSAEMANQLLDRRARAEDRLLTFSGAGHFLRPPVIPTTVPWSDTLFSGGTALGNARAQAEAWQATLDFLALHVL